MNQPHYNHGNGNNKKRNACMYLYLFNYCAGINLIEKWNYVFPKSFEHSSSSSNNLSHAFIHGILPKIKYCTTDPHLCRNWINSFKIQLPIPHLGTLGFSVLGHTINKLLLHTQVYMYTNRLVAGLVSIKYNPIMEGRQSFNVLWGNICASICDTYATKDYK